MRVSKWRNSVAIRLLASIVEALGLKKGVHVEVQGAGERAIAIANDENRQRALARIRAFRKPLPPGWKFDREDANSR